MRLFSQISIFVTSVVVLLGVVLIYVLIGSFEEIETDRVYERLDHVTDVNKQKFLDQTDHLQKVVRTISQTPPINAILRGRQNPSKVDPVTGENVDIWLRRLTQIFRATLEANDQFSQIRLISTRPAGQEILRLDKLSEDIQVIPEEKLQNKSQRPYYLEAIQKGKGEVYFSEIDLNRDYGDVTTPFTLTLRAAIPLYIENSVEGLLVINFELNPLMETFLTNKVLGVQTFLVDNEGNYLSHEDPNSLYSVELNKQNLFKESFPQLSAKVQELMGVDGVPSFHMQNLKMFSSVSLLHYSPGYPERAVTFVSFLPFSESRAFFGDVLDVSLLPILIIIGICLIVLFVWVEAIMRPLKALEILFEDIDSESPIPLSVRKVKTKEFASLFRSFLRTKEKLSEGRRELIKSQKKIAESEKYAALGVLSGGLAHEINNPLAIISIQVETLECLLSDPQKNKEKIKENLSKIESTTNRIANVVKSLKSFSRDLNNNELREIVVNDLLRDVKTFVDFNNRNKQVDIAFEFTDPDLRIKAQGTQISQALINLINNGKEAVKSGDEPWVRVSASSKEGFLFIRVQDSGTIDPKIVDQILEPFFTTKDPGEGTGLGLSLSKGFVEGNGGDLYVETNQERTTFVIRLPLFEE